MLTCLTRRRRLLLPLVIVALFIAGCDRAEPEIVEIVAGPTGTDRLVLRDIVTRSATEEIHRSHSIAWQRFEDGSWVDHLTITHRKFQGDHPHRRWISELHSFEPESGTAILKIAEGNAPEGSRTGVMYIYSWRKWDLTNNREIEVIGVCEDPFATLAETIEASSP
jgi:hypothetical protein